jgi:hypothetical protein
MSLHFRNLKVHYHVHKSPPRFLILNQTNLVHSTQSYFSKIHLVLSSHLRLGLPSGLFPCGFSAKILYVFLFAPCVLHALPISFSLTWSLQLYLAKSTSYEARHYAAFSLFGPNILLSTLFPNTFSLRSSLNVRDPVTHPYKTTGKIIVLYRRKNYYCTMRLRFSLSSLPSAFKLFVLSDNHYSISGPQTQRVSYFQ